MCAILAREPFHMPREDWPLLDRWTVAHVYLRPRKPDGTLLARPAPGKAALSPKAAYFQHWRSFGLPDHRIEELYAAEQAVQKALLEKVRAAGRRPGRR